MRQSYVETLTYPDEDGFSKHADSAEVFVYKAGTEELATIYEQRSGGSPKVNPFVVGSNGFCNFWADTGDYDIEIHDTEVPARFGDLKYGWQSSPVDTQVEAADLSDNGDVTWSQEGGGAWVPQLKPGVVGPTELGANAVETAKIKDDAVTSGKIVANAVGASEIGTLPLCHVRKTTTTAIASFTPTYLTFPTEVEDSDGMHSTVSNTGRIVCVTPGIYDFWAQLLFESTTAAEFSAWFRRTLQAGGNEIRGFQSKNYTSISSTESLSLSVPIRLAVGDYVEVGFSSFAGDDLIGVNEAWGNGQEFGCVWLTD